MPHARKPKISVPPGLSTSSHEDSVVALSAKVHHLESQVQSLMTLAHEMSMNKIVERLELLEHIFLFVDIDALNAAMQRCSADETKHDKFYSDQHFKSEQEPFDLSDPFALLSDMAAQGSNLEQVVVSFGSHHDTIDCSTGQSLVMSRLDRRWQLAKQVSLLKLQTAAADAITCVGTVAELLERGLLSSGAYIESTQCLHVGLRGFNGIDYTTASSFIRVREIEENVVTLTDCAPEPSLDRGGRRVFGKVRDRSEVFVVVGHSQLGGIQTDFEELSEKIHFH